MGVAASAHTVSIHRADSGTHGRRLTAPAHPIARPIPERHCRHDGHRPARRVGAAVLLPIARSSHWTCPLPANRRQAEKVLAALPLASPGQDIRLP